MWTSSSSTCSSMSSSPLRVLPAANKTMEEVWKDISLASSDLTHHHNHPVGAATGVILQDFFSKDPPLMAVSSSPSPAAPPPPPPTLLTLSSATHHFTSLLLHHPISHMGFDAVVPENNINGGGGIVRKRFPEFDKTSGDRRHKRMIKNRESAARSRARKQAYTNELELEVAHLVEENARLKEQQQQLYRAAAAQQQIKKKPPLHRTSTAPF